MGDNDKLTDAKDLLQSLLGLAGVVLGYYFGRIPAEARTAQANAEATAKANAAAVRAKSQEISDRLEEVMVNAPTRSLHTTEEQSWRQLRKLHNELVSSLEVSRDFPPLENDVFLGERCRGPELPAFTLRYRGRRNGLHR